MSKRLSGALRLGLGLPLYVLAVIVTWPLMLLTIAIWLVDSIWQISTNTDGITKDNPAAKVYNWYVGLFRYVAFGDSSTGGGKSVSRWARR